MDGVNRWKQAQAFVVLNIIPGKFSAAKFTSHNFFFFIRLQHILNSSLNFWLALFTLCSELRWSDGWSCIPVFRAISGSVLVRLSLKAPSCIKQLTLWSRPTNYLIVLGLLDVFGCKGSGLPGFKAWEMQTGIIRQGKQPFNKATTFEDKPRAVWNPANLSENPTS